MVKMMEKVVTKLDTQAQRDDAILGAITGMRPATAPAPSEPNRFLVSPVVTDQTNTPRDLDTALLQHQERYKEELNQLRHQMRTQHDEVLSTVQAQFEALPLQGPATTVAWSDKPNNVEVVRGEATRVKKAMGFVKEQKANLERSMQELRRAREEWKADMAIARRDTSGGQRRFLEGVKEALDQQANELSHTLAKLF